MSAPQAENSAPTKREFRLDPDGFEFLRNFVPPDRLRPIATEVEASGGTVPQYGIRNAEKKFASIAELAASLPILDSVRRYTGKQARLIRAIFFDKTPEANWYVTWHQDKTVAVPRRFDAPGWGPWSVKDGVAHVQPPREILERLLTLRIHLDNTDESNGCLQVVPHSHRAGLLPASAIRERVNRSGVVACTMKAGDALLMRPLLLHASRRASNPSRRRVLHLEYGDFDLPDNGG